MKKTLTKRLAALAAALLVLSTLITGAVYAGTETAADLPLAKDFSHPEDHTDPDSPYVQEKDFRDKVADVIIGAGEALLPGGETIKNVIKYLSPSKDGNTLGDTVISVAADGARLIFPVAAPIVSVAEDIFKKVRDLF